MYGRIVAEADRELVPEKVIMRTIQYGIANYPELDYELQYKRFVKHLEEKYSSDGYIKLWIPGSSNEKHLSALRDIINDKKALRAEFERIYAGFWKN